MKVALAVRSSHSAIGAAAQRPHFLEVERGKREMRTSSVNASCPNGKIKLRHCTMRVKFHIVPDHHSVPLALRYQTPRALVARRGDPLHLSALTICKNTECFEALEQLTRS